MNKVILMGRLTRDPDVRWTQGPEQSAVARYTLAVDRRFQKEGGAAADFIGCVAFGRQAEFAEKYLRQGTKIAITGRIQTGSYTNREGRKVYTTDVVVEEQEFAEGKNAERPREQGTTPQANTDGFMTIPDGVDEDIPFM
jgi:single-strand DNA-binding protein